MKETLLAHIDNPVDLRKLKVEQLPILARELRDFIIDIISQKEGHLGASLGVIELTIALHYVFDTPNDLLVWDVGHQAYGHKILTERRDIFHTNRDLDGISGFPKRDESVYDTFGTGHSSTAISAALGMAIANSLQGKKFKHIAVVGDASIASGMAFEALNHAGVTNADILIILNDNAIGIDPSVGALKHYLTSTKSGKDTGSENIFESLNLNYSGPMDGHDLQGLIEVLELQKELTGPRILHIRTVKGKGLKLAEEDQVLYHAPGKFDKITGKVALKDDSHLSPKFQDVFGKTLVELATLNEKIVGITPAMPTGSSMKFMMEQFPDRAIDVGIAEQHAVTLAAGMTTQGLTVFCNIYSTFLQRAYDQIIHDVALQNLPVIFCLDRAGLVGQDGATHHGVYDLAYLNCIPNMIIAAPIDEVDLRNIMFTAQANLTSPIAIRYPRGRGYRTDWKQPFTTLQIGKAKTLLLNKSKGIAVLSLGTIGASLQKWLLEETLEITHVDMRFLKPLDTNILDQIFLNHHTVITLEEGTIIGGLGSSVMDYAFAKAYSGKITKLGIPDIFIQHGPTADLHKLAGIDRETVLNKIKKYL